jgi:hypothetical protein
MTIKYDNRNINAQLLSTIYVLICGLKILEMLAVIHIRIFHLPVSCL